MTIFVKTLTQCEITLHSIECESNSRFLKLGVVKVLILVDFMKSHKKVFHADLMEGINAWALRPMHNMKMESSTNRTLFPMRYYFAWDLVH